jgi:hypothetical protein
MSFPAGPPDRPPACIPRARQKNFFPFLMFIRGLIILGVLSWLLLPPRGDKCGAELKNFWSLDNPKVGCKCE